jgi:hypothetical protein
MKTSGLIVAAFAAVSVVTPAKAQVWIEAAPKILQYGQAAVGAAARGAPWNQMDTARRVAPYVAAAGGPMRYETTPAYMSRGRPVYSNGPTIGMGGFRRR